MNPKPPRHWLKVLSFVVVVLIGDRIGGYAMSCVFQSTQFRFSQIYSGDLPADLVFIGNSRGVHMFHRPPLEAVSGKRVANLSFNGMPAELMPSIFADYLAHHPSPEKLFIEVSCIGRENEPGSLERFTVLMGESKSTTNLIARTHPNTYWSCQLSHLYRFNSELTWRSLFFLRNTDQDWIMDGEVASDWQDHYPESRFREFERSDIDVHAIRELIELARQSDVGVELVLAPYLPDYYQRLNPNHDWLAWLESELGQKVVDYSSSIQTRESFADPIHLNPSGAIRFADFLQEQDKL